MPVTFIAHAESTHDLAAVARLREAAGFDRLLMPFDLSDAQARDALEQASRVTTRLGFVVPDAGLLQPSQTLRQVAALQQATGGRLAIRVDAPVDISAGIDSRIVLHHLPPAPLGDVARRARSLRHRVERAGHHAHVALSFRTVMADTQEAAWKRASSIMTPPSGLLARIGLQQRKALAQVDGDAVTLIGTPDQVAGALLDHGDVGVDHVILHGADPLDGELMSIVRRKVARRDAALGVLAG